MNYKIPLIIDSSIYKQIPKLNSPLFIQLIKYIRLNIFELYIPEIVENEYLTWIRKESQEAYDTVVKATESLNKYYEDENIMGFELKYNFAASVAGNQINEILKKIFDNWRKFKINTNATILPINNNHGKIVMDAYFYGKTPFKSVKNRADIPDAFIYYSMLDLLKRNKRIVFISQDKEFCNKIAEKRISIFTNLSELFKCNDYKISDDYFMTLQNAEKTKALFQYFRDEIILKIERKLCISDSISEFEKEYWDILIGNYKEVTLKVESINFDVEKVNGIKKYTFMVPISAKIIHTFYTEASKDEVDAINIERVNGLFEKSINEKMLYDITEKFQYTVIGNISISFAKSNPLFWEEKKVFKNFFNEKEIKEIKIDIENLEKLA